MLWRKRKKPESEADRARKLRARGSRMLERHKVDEALRLLREAAAIEPSSFEGRINLGSACYMKGEHEEAIQHFQYVVAIDPYHPMALLNLAAAYDATGRLEESIHTLEQLRIARPKFPDVHYNLAIAYMKRNDSAKAEEMLREELRVNPNNRNARDLLNRLYLRPRGRTGETDARIPDEETSKQPLT